MTAFANAWTGLKRIIFDSGFEAGLGALGRQLATTFDSDAAKKFAADIGSALGSAARSISALISVAVQNQEPLTRFVKVLGAMAGATLALGVMRLLLTPLQLLGVGFAVTGSAAALLSTTLNLLNKRILLIPAGITVALAALDHFVNKGRILAATLDFTKVTITKLGEAMESGLEGIFRADFGDLGAQFRKALADADAFAKAIQDAELVDPAAIQRNARIEADNNAKKLAALSDVEQAVWDEVNAVGKANSEYQQQLKLLDAIAGKKGISADSWKRVLAAQTLDERNPAGALARDYGVDLANLVAKTGEQRALNAAQSDYNALLLRGQDIGNAGLDALRQYHTAIARMTGEIGNGFERWSATVGDFNDNLQEAIKDGIGGLSDEIANFVTGAEADFAGLARSILRTFVKISLDSLLKDLFGAMGMNPEANSASLAEQALSKIAGIGENITTAMTNVYTTGLTVNGMPLNGPGSFANSPELPANRERLRRATEAASPSSAITRAPLADIPGTSVAGRLSDANSRFALEAITKTTAKTSRLGYIDPNINPERFGPSQPVTLNVDSVALTRSTSGNPFLDLIGRAEGTDRGRGYDETLAYGKFTGGNRNLTGMSLNEIDALQTQMLRHPENTFNSSALGRYQITQRTMRGLRSQMGLSGSELYDPGMQDAMAMRLMARRGNNVAGLRNEWEGLRRVDPATIKSTYSASTIDPATTGSIDALNSKLQTIGQTAAQTAPAFDTMRAANQNLATASTMAGTNVATAGPQFQQAGQQIATAGQQAAMGAQQAQTATPSLNGFGQGITGLLGPLASAIPGLGQFGGMIMQLAQSLFSGGGGLMGGIFAEGGYATQPVTRAALPAGLWSNAPHYAEGTANTSGGMPAVLHPNEAVIPLTKGRAVPVELNDNHARSNRDHRQGPAVNNFIFQGVKDADSFRRSQQQVKSQMLSNMQRASFRNG